MLNSKYSGLVVEFRRKRLWYCIDQSQSYNLVQNDAVQEEFVKIMYQNAPNCIYKIEQYTVPQSFTPKLYWGLLAYTLWPIEGFFTIFIDCVALGKQENNMKIELVVSVHLSVCACSQD